MSSSDNKETSRTTAIQDLDETPQIHLGPGVRLFDSEFVSQLPALLLNSSLRDGGIALRPAGSNGLKSRMWFLFLKRIHTST